MDTPPQNRSARRAEGRRGRKIAAIGSGAALASTGAAATVALTATPAGAATIVVQNTNDAGAGSLREALANANDNDVIDLTALSGTISLSSGELLVEDAVTITGPGSSALTIDANNASRIFTSTDNLDAGETLTITGLSLVNGNGEGSGTNEAGGAVFVEGADGVPCNAVLDDMVMLNNTSQDRLGGAFYFDHCDGGSVTINSSRFSDNHGNTAGLWMDEVGTVTMTNSTVSGNVTDAPDPCCGTFYTNAQNTTIINSTFANNQGPYPGIVRHLDGGDLTIANSTFTGNQPGTYESGGYLGGGVLYGDWANVTIEQSTFAGNSTNGNGAVLFVEGGGETTVSVVGSIFADDTDASGSDASAVEIDTALAPGAAARPPAQEDKQRGGDVGAAAIVTVTVDHSLVEGVFADDITVNDAGGNLFGVDPFLGELASNGGPTQTKALLPGSPAIDTGPDPVPDFPGNEFDQRGPGFARIVFGRVDIGAFEVQAPVIELVPTFTG